MDRDWLLMACNNPECDYEKECSYYASDFGDFRAGDGKQQPDILRFGLTPLYTRFVDVWHAVQHLKEVMDSGEWQQARFSHKNTVT